MNFSIRVTDNTAVKRVTLILKNNDTKKSLSYDMVYNQEKDVYEYNLLIDDTVEKGHWYIDRIEAYDTLENYASEWYGLNGERLWFIVANDGNGLELQIQKNMRFYHINREILW